VTGRRWGTSAVEVGTWERIARALKEEPGLSDSAVSRRLGVGRRAAASVRRDLGIAPYQQTPRLWTTEQIAALCEPLPGGHQIWGGRVGGTGTPMADRVSSVNQVVFRLHYGREPLGRVYGVCRRKRCVAGAHLQDDLMRAQDPDRMTLHGLDLLAIRTALTCDPPFPRLKVPEARLAFRMVDLAEWEDRGPELAARMSVTSRTFERWKAKGAPSPW
jgi:hypothetical protein